jgi:hypothetical protein
MRIKRQVAFLATALLALSACADMNDANRTKSPGPAYSDGTTPQTPSRTNKKRPDPQNLRFVQNFDDYSPLSELIGQIWLRNVDNKTFIDYKPRVRPHPTDTRIVVVCSVTHEKLTFPVDEDFYGPAPACREKSDLLLAAE